jgi:hypothetical protein
MQPPECFRLLKSATAGPRQDMAPTARPHVVARMDLAHTTRLRPFPRSTALQSGPCGCIWPCCHPPPSSPAACSHSGQCGGHFAAPTWPTWIVASYSQPPMVYSQIYCSSSLTVLSGFGCVMLASGHSASDARPSSNSWFRTPQPGSCPWQTSHTVQERLRTQCLQRKGHIFAHKTGTHACFVPYIPVQTRAQAMVVWRTRSASQRLRAGTVPPPGLGAGAERSILALHGRIAARP